jgi:hypothetical protein
MIQYADHAISLKVIRSAASRGMETASAMTDQIKIRFRLAMICLPTNLAVARARAIRLTHLMA